MSDQTYDEAMDARFRKFATAIGADYTIDPAARAALSDQLVFLRQQGFIEEEVEFVEAVDGGVAELHPAIGLSCNDQSAVLLGRLAERGWHLVHHVPEFQHEAAEKMQEAVG